MTSVPPANKTSPSAPPPLESPRKTKAEHRVEKKAIETLKNITDTSLDIAVSCIDPELKHVLIVTLPVGIILGIVGGISLLTQKILQSLWGTPTPVTLQYSFKDWLQSSEEVWNKNEEHEWLDQKTVALFKEWRAALVKYNQDYQSQITELQQKTKDQNAIPSYNKKAIDISSLFKNKIIEVEREYYKHRKEKSLEKAYAEYEAGSKDSPKMTFEEFKKADLDKIREKYVKYLSDFRDDSVSSPRSFEDFVVNEVDRGIFGFQMREKTPNYIKIVQKNLT